MGGLRQFFQHTFESVLNAASFGRGIQWSINGLPCRIDARFRSQMSQHYDAEVSSYLRKLIRPGMVCYDVGANVGVYVLQFGAWVGSNGKVVAFEPNPATASALHRHVHMNGIADRTVIVPAAVSSACGEAILHAADCDGMSRLGAPNTLLADRTRAISVPKLTLDSYHSESGIEPDVILIDVEGFEIQVLKGASNLLRKRRDLIVIVEMHPNVWDSADTTVESAEVLLKDLNYNVVPLTGQKNPVCEYGMVALAPSSNSH